MSLITYPVRVRGGNGHIYEARTCPAAVMWANQNGLPFVLDFTQQGTSNLFDHIESAYVDNSQNLHDVVISGTNPPISYRVKAGYQGSYELTYSGLQKITISCPNATGSDYTSMLFRDFSNGTATYEAPVTGSTGGQSVTETNATAEAIEDTDSQQAQRTYDLGARTSLATLAGAEAVDASDNHASLRTVDLSARASLVQLAGLIVQDGDNHAALRSFDSQVRTYLGTWNTQDPTDNAYTSRVYDKGARASLVTLANAIASGKMQVQDAALEALISSGKLAVTDAAIEALISGGKLAVIDSVAEGYLNTLAGIVVAGQGIATVPSTTAHNFANRFTRAISSATASTNYGVVNASPGVLWGIEFYNSPNTVCFAQFYTKSSNPVPGTDTPALTIPLLAATSTTRAFAAPFSFNPGMAFALTTDFNGTTLISAGGTAGTIISG